MTVDADAPRIPLIRSLEILRSVRRDDEIVIPTMGNAREWMKLGEPHPLDFILVPSAMGHGTSIGLGLALARPDRRVIVCSGDGSLLMNLGSLASIVAARATNLVVLVFDNGVYEVTGQQPTAGATVDFTAVARGCGFTSVHRFSDAGAWAANARGVIDATGPTLIALDVEPVAGGTAPHSPGPNVARAAAFRKALGERPAR
ncbi:MAG TPA: thiamine pyrophosphate-dependent enzyme [Gemmatimonadaceae bacterium]|nr:thiamine pyrophosphate-dependent enzyme [Gemmatimonadaceae bacterium]